MRRRASLSHPRSDATIANVARRVERILKTRNLNLAEVSRKLHQLYPQTPHYIVPHNFYYDLGLPGYTPRIEQILALSRISNYRLADWLTVFGVHLDDIPRLQADFPSPQTALLDRTCYKRSDWIRWFDDTSGDRDHSSVAPLGQLLASTRLCRIGSLLAEDPSPFLYAKIGRQDAFAFPDLLPGSIIRADKRGIGELLQTMQSRDSERLFLVEHGRGIVCCRLHLRSKGRVTLRSERLPFAQTELRLGSEARILGILDWELRPLDAPPPEVPTASMRFLKPPSLTITSTSPSLRELLAHARARGGLSIRNASARTRWVAQMLGDERYFCASASLADFESVPRLPVHVHKIFSLCVIYAFTFWELLIAAGIDTSDSGHEPIPDELVGRKITNSLHRTDDAGGRTEKQSHFLSALVADFQEIPFFLRHSLPAIIGHPAFSKRDVFWIGGTEASLHPYLQGALFVSVNRRLKKPVFLKRKSLWEQPLYVLMLREGGYLLAGCSVEGTTLIAHPFAAPSPAAQMFRLGVDVEVVGKITALLRRLR